MFGGIWDKTTGDFRDEGTLSITDSGTKPKTSSQQAKGVNSSLGSWGHFIIKMEKEEPEMTEIDKDNAKVLLSVIGEIYKCGFCGKEITENNFGIIHKDVQVCNNILCQIWGIDKLKLKKTK